MAVQRSQGSRAAPGNSTMMLKWLTVLVAFVLVGFAPAWTAVADDKPTASKGVEGSWEGPLKETPQLELRITLEVTKRKDGSLSGKWGSPDEALKDLPLRSITLKDGSLTFATQHGVTYRGKLNRAGTEVVGEWTQRGKKIPLTFKR